MKERLDVLLVKRGLCDSRSKAKAYIMEGVVYVEGVREDKAGSPFEETVKIEIKSNPIPFVSRGGLKIQKALKEFGISLEGKTAMDVGASTGGFTDCMLQNGAELVYSIDVGYGQLDYRLRTDRRVVVMERTNIRNVTPEDIDTRPQFASCDVSFISLKTVIPVIKSLMEKSHEIVALIKPQFEVGKNLVGKNGVVREERLHKEVVTDIATFCKNIGYEIGGISYSPIKGPKGNIEFLIYLRSDTGNSIHVENDIEKIILLAHKELKGN